MWKTVCKFLWERVVPNNDKLMTENCRDFSPQKNNKIQGFNPFSTVSTPLLLLLDLYI